jgi:hypothetical protein
MHPDEDNESNATTNKPMSLRDAYRQKMEAQIEEQRARLELLKAKAKRAVADGKLMAYEELAEAERNFDLAKARLKELGAASEGAWEDMKSGVEGAWASLKAAGEKAADKFK